MPNIYARDVPRDLYTRIKKVKKQLGTKTWVSFFYEIIHRIEDELDQEEMLNESKKRREGEET